MFICDRCGNKVERRISPFAVTSAVRKVSYTHYTKDEDNNKIEVISQGTEIVHENKLCPACANMKVTQKPVPDNSGYVNIAHGMQKHAAGCKKMLEDCNLCKGNIVYFGTFPLDALSEALENRPRNSTALRHTFGAACVDSLLRRVEEHSARAKRDFEVGFPILKAYQERGGKI